MKKNQEGKRKYIRKYNKRKLGVYEFCAISTFLQITFIRIFSYYQNEQDCENKDEFERKWNEIRELIV